MSPCVPKSACCKLARSFFASIVQDGWGSLVIVLIGAHLAALLFWLFQLAKTSGRKPEGKQE